MSKRHVAGQSIVGCIVGPVEDLFYGFEEKNKENVEFVAYQEPVVPVHGEIASYDENKSDEEVLECLQSLFTALGEAPLQTTVRFTYWGKDGYRESFRLRLPNTHHPLDSSG